MTEKQPARREKTGNRIASIVLFVLAGLLVAAAIAGFILRGTEQSQSNLTNISFCLTAWLAGS